MKLMWVDITIMSFSQLQKISAPASNKEISGGKHSDVLWRETTFSYFWGYIYKLKCESAILMLF